jgi:hypothetical protein
MIVYNTWWTGTNADLGYDRIARLLDIANVGALKWSSPDAFVYEGRAARDQRHPTRGLLGRR